MMRMRPDANVPAAIVVLGHRDNLDANHARKGAGSLLKARENFPGATIVVSVGGYDDDKRELWEIPEVCGYVLDVFDAVFEDWPSGNLDDLNLHDESRTIVLACTGVLRVAGRDQASGKYVFRLAD
jgi:hypothetical protein